MFSIRAILLLSLFASSALTSPIDHLSHLRAARDEAILYPRQEQSTLSQPITFQTVTTSQTDAGTITTTCTVTLSPVTAADGSTQVLEEKQCKIDVGAGSESSSSSSSNGGGDSTAQTSTTSSSTETATQSQDTQTLTSSSSALTTATAVPAISEIGVGTIPASATGTVSPPSSSASASETASASGSAPPAVSVIGPGQIPASATGTVSPVAAPASSTDTASVTTPVTSVTTLSNGQISTSVITPSAAAAQEAAATTPGQKLEVLPIGLGVFAGVSVIALIVVGLVTYERTKYRKAFRQRKLAEAGANLGYGGMAERT